MARHFLPSGKEISGRKQDYRAIKKKVAGTATPAADGL